MIFAGCDSFCMCSVHFFRERRAGASSVFSGSLAVVARSNAAARPAGVRPCAHGAKRGRLPAAVMESVELSQRADTKLI